MEPIYAVVGSPRSGTSATMRALIAGSDLKPLYTKGRSERMAAKFDGDGYQFNGNKEIYELEMCGHDGEGNVDPESCSGIVNRAVAAKGMRAPTDDELRDPEALQAIIDPSGIDKPVALCGSDDCLMTFRLRPELYAGRLIKIIVPSSRPWSPFWDYPPASCGYRAVWLVREYLEVAVSAAQAAQNGNRIAVPNTRASFNSLLYGTLTSSLADEHQVESSVVLLKNLVRNPEREFQKLVLDGWPIDPVACAKKIDSSKYRVHVEDVDREVTL